MRKPPFIVDKSTGQVMPAEDFIKREVTEWRSAFKTLGLELIKTPFEFLSDLTSDLDPYKIKKQNDLEHYIALLMRDLNRKKK